jgi:tripeptidyl-peptidase-1
MKHYRQLLVLLLLLCSTSIFSLGVEAASKKTIKASSNIPSSWVKKSAPKKSKVMTFDLYLNAPNRAGLHTKMTSISKNPKKSWLTSAEAAAYVTPTTTSRNAVIKALKAAGIPSANLTWSTLKDRVTVKTTVSKVETFLDTTISSYSHNGEVALPKAKSVTLPSSISAHVYSVGTLLAFGSPSLNRENYQSAGDITLSRRRMVERSAEDEVKSTSLAKRTTSPPSTCMSSGGHYYNYPRCLIDYYGLPQTSKSLARRNDLAIIGYLAENFSQSDLTTAMKAFRTDQPNAAKYQMYLNDLLGATNSGSDPSGEAALDSQIAVGMTWPLESTYYNIGDKDGTTVGADTGDIFLSAFQYFLELDASVRPSVITVSYGILDEASMTSTADAMCNAAQLLSAFGTTIVFSAGDSGPDGTARAQSTPYPDNSGSCLPLTPSYPSGCPYILSVGATTGYYEAEQPVYYGTPSGLSGYNWAWASGSGFSEYWDTPDYQKSALSTWAARSNALFSSATKGQYTSTGRAFPDVTALGVDYPIVISGSAYLQAGTSMSSPVFAAVLALLNGELRDAGMPTVGYVHPMFYANPSAFKDITLGGSWWKCGSGTTYGFNATTGWDAASGLGSPNYTSLATLYGL